MNDLTTTEAKLEKARMALIMIKEDLVADCDHCGRADRIEIDEEKSVLSPKFGMDASYPKLEVFIDHILKITE